MAKIYPVGDPENDSEREAIRGLAELLPDEYAIFHNFEITTRRGFPYEVDVLVVGPHALYLCEVKGYRGRIHGDASRWRLEPSGASHANPIPLANTKTRVLHDKMADKDRALRGTLVVALIILTDEKVRVGNLRDDRRDRVLRLEEAAAFIQDPNRLPIRNAKSIASLHNRIVATLNASSPSHKTTSIGLYEIIEKMNQTERRTVYLARHRYLKSRPKTVLQVYHFDPYLKEQERNSQIEAIFHDQEALSHVSNHPNIIHSGEMFAWEGNEFVLPHEFIEEAQTLRMLIDDESEALTWAQKRRIVSGTARGLEHAHEHGVIHRDIRPLNIVAAPKEGIVKLVNFDLALIGGDHRIDDWKGLDKQLDRRYCAPEVWHDLAAATERSDLYSLGLVFYELLTGERAYESIEDLAETRKVPLDLDRLESQLSTSDGGASTVTPRDVCSVIARMCEFDAEKRYGSMRGVIEDLSIIGDE